jgi:hypothetical protein
MLINNVGTSSNTRTTVNNSTDFIPPSTANAISGVVAGVGSSVTNNVGTTAGNMVEDANGNVLPSQPSKVDNHIAGSTVQSGASLTNNVGSTMLTNNTNITNVRTDYIYNTTYQTNHNTYTTEVKNYYTIAEKPPIPTTNQPNYGSGGYGAVAENAMAEEATSSSAGTTVLSQLIAALAKLNQAVDTVTIKFTSPTSSGAADVQVQSANKPEEEEAKAPTPTEQAQDGHVSAATLAQPGILTAGALLLLALF